jgi:hypothetical protein
VEGREGRSVRKGEVTQVRRRRTDRVWSDGIIFDKSIAAPRGHVDGERQRNAF